MRKAIFTIFTIFTVTALGASLSFAQTKRKTTVRRAGTGKAATVKTVKRTTVRKTTGNTIKKTTVTKKMENTLNNAVTTASGLTYIITKQGDGAPVKAGDNVIVNYTGLLTNGAKFDSSLDRNEPFSFPVGAGMVIKGWDEGLQNLRVGDHATLIIPAEIGYGARGAGGVIPPNATLIFIIEVLGVK